LTEEIVFGTIVFLALWFGTLALKLYADLKKRS